MSRGEEHRMPLTLYLAGPMTGHPNYNYPAFHQAARDLRELGYFVVSPAEDTWNRPIPPPEPEHAAPHGHYVRAGLRKLLHADAVALLPGWGTSKGTSVELTVARAIGMDIHTVEHWEDHADQIGEAPIYLTVDRPDITDDDRAQAMRMTMKTGRQVVLTARPRRWWHLWRRHD